MDRIEPYIGMPIVLGDSCHFDHSDEQNKPQCMPEAAPQVQTQMQPQVQPQVPQQSACQKPSPCNPPQEQQSCQPCLTDDNCTACSGQQPPQQIMRVAMAYVPWQRWQQPYDYEKGLETGTIFPDLDLPFLGYQGGRRR